MYTLYDYLKEEESFTMEEAHEIHQELLKSLNDDEEFKLYDDIIKASVNYITIRAKWNVYPEERNNEARTAYHDAVIESFDVLAEYQRDHGRETKWRDEIGYEENGKYFRKRIGDFGIYLAFLKGLEAR